ncbi:hypothetical protein K431DRAFT_289525 [Polychaeton citri CBS 116435]|uniref:non-specific serine/threonine protein kinase n=1 Tax=Polychaeton citri CBS 116435 TaxID=1314669 RepID=A0A9P4Q1D4_9PEZI|nr:hypothetical protein K431DRAFT_289525 [Polychaeton citri CBS 116435]
MPNKHVYGKRSRAVYDPLAIFESPHGQEENNNKHSRDLQNREPGRNRKDDAVGGKNSKGSDSRKKERNVLCEKSFNAVVNALGPKVVAEKTCGPITTSDSREALGKPNHNRNRFEVKSRATKLSRHVGREIEQKVAAPRRTNHAGCRSKLKVDLKGDASGVPAASLNVKTSHSVSHRQTKPRAYESITSLHDIALPDLSNLASDESSTSHSNAHCASLLDLSSHCITPFEDWSSELSSHFTVTKIAEASFGEVYRLSLKQNWPLLSLSRGEESVLKIIALTPPESTLPTAKRARNAALKRAEAMSAPADVASEVRLLQRMASTPGFTNFRDLRILRGKPNKVFADAYKQFNAAQEAKDKEMSIFPDPAKKNAYREEQLWAVIEMQDAGTDLERLVEDGQFADIWHIWDAFWQVVLALAKGEEEAEYEHRDLHLGNICIRQSAKTGSGTDGQRESPSKALDIRKKLSFTDTEVTLIDYTISRCRMSPAADADMTSTPDIAYTDLSHSSQEMLFDGDSTSEYQYEIYRYMRSTLLFSNPLKPFKPKSNRKGNNDNDKFQHRSWADFCPATNLVWLHYVLYKLLEQIDWPSAIGPKAILKQKHGSRERKEWRRACDLESALLNVRELLEPEALERHATGDSCYGTISSAGELVSFAVSEGWLDVEDIVGQDLDGEEELLVRQIQGMALQKEMDKAVV